MQNQLRSIKPELLASALGGGREVEAEPGTIMLNVSRSGVPEILLLRHGTAPACGGSLGLAPSEFTLATIRCTGVKGFCRSQPGPKLSLCQVAQVSVHRASGVLQYWESQPCVSPADGELSINQCLFSMICLQSPELTWLTAV